MRLQQFKVARYRSIKNTLPIALQHNITIIGPNNEGKSNLVRALVTSLQLLAEHAQFPRRARVSSASIRRANRSYNWESDFPLDLQDQLHGYSEFKLDFELSKDDQAEFLDIIGSSINNKLPITVQIGRNSIPLFQVNKPGKGYAALTNKSSEIAAFIGSKLSINYIPAIRTARDSARSVETLVSSALRKVENTPEYLSALETIDKLQRPVLDELESRLQSTLETFVPTIKRVDLKIREGSRDALRSVTIGIDDGQLTPLENKGDGIISLVGMALLSRLDSYSSSDINMVLAIEEPESHLHPRAIHSIRSILDGLGNDIQVIITTHSPALVNRINISGNILVERNQARVVSKISEIRDALGVRVSDNLTNSRLVVICEGENDQKLIGSILSEIEPKLIKHLKTSEIGFSSLNGSSKLSYLATTFQNSICEPICLLDDDKAGHDACNAAVKDAVIAIEDVVFTSRLGKDESEFEDLICDDIVEKIALANYRVKLSDIPQGFKKKKFSVRAEAAFKKAGRAWNDQVKMAFKSKISSECELLGLRCIDPDRRTPLETLSQLILERLGD